MCETIFKKFSELPESVDFKTVNSGWTWGCGGYGLKDHQWHIDYTHDDLSADIYVLPNCFNDMIITIKRWSQEETQQRIQRALGI